MLHEESKCIGGNWGELLEQFLAQAIKETRASEQAHPELGDQNVSGGGLFYPEH